MAGKRVLVCGGRNYKDWDAIERWLSPMPISFLIEGGASGADYMARQWAVKHGVPFETFEAEWEKHGRAAGPIRNRKMLEEGKPDVVLAFPGGKGTADMVRAATDAGLEVLLVG